MKFNRWCIVFKHDKSPVDECLFTHKLKADKKMNEMNNKLKLEVISVELRIKEV